MELKLLYALESRLKNLQNKSGNKQEIEKLTNSIKRMKTHIAKIDNLNSQIQNNFQELYILKQQTQLYKLLLKIIKK
jgi:hypothetical protein